MHIKYDIDTYKLLCYSKLRKKCVCELMQIKRNTVFKLDMLVLSILKRGDYYGYEIASIINKESNDLFFIKEGVLYPILYRLEQAGFISSFEKIIGRKIRVYYHITEAGIKELNFLEDDFKKKIKAINLILGRELYETEK